MSAVQVLVLSRHEGVAVAALELLLAAAATVAGLAAANMVSCFSCWLGC